MKLTTQVNKFTEVFDTTVIKSGDAIRVSWKDAGKADFNALVLASHPVWLHIILVSSKTEKATPDYLYVEDFIDGLFTISKIG